MREGEGKEGRVGDRETLRKNTSVHMRVCAWGASGWVCGVGVRCR